jgi:acetyl-CoA synthetase
MTTTVNTAPEGISNLLTIEEEYSSRSCVSTVAHQKHRDYECKRALDFPDVHHQWFTGAKLNITLNALDRHADSDRRNRVAYIWLGEDGTERQVTYGQLHAQVCRFANGLKSLGVKKGDRVIIYMPLTLAGVISMLACARIGAVHAVVYAGLGHTAWRDRITRCTRQDCHHR